MTRHRLLLIALAFLAAGFAYFVLRPGHPQPSATGAAASTAPSTAAAADVASAAETRRALFGTFVLAEHWLILADSYARSGDRQGAIETIRSGLKAHPKDAELWTGLGYSLAAQAGKLTPEAQSAFTKAIDLAPSSPGPRYFRGRALLDTGNRAGAVAEWKSILGDAPAKVSWRTFMEQEIARASGGGGSPPSDTGRR